MIARTPWRAYLLLCSGMAVVGGYVGFSKLLVSALPVYLLALLRFAIAALVMAPITCSAKSMALAWRHRGTLVLQSLFGNVLFTICMLFGVARTSATATGLIMSTLPAMVALLSALTLRESIHWRTVCAVLLAVGGVALLSWQQHLGAGLGGVSGNLLVVAAVGCEATYVVLGKRLTSAAVAPLQISAWINLIGLVLMLPLGLWQARAFAFASVEPLLWLLLVVYALAASVLSTWLWLSGLRRVPASQAGVFTVALPVSAALVGLVFLHEHLAWPQGVAFVCAVSGILLVASGAASAPVEEVR